MFREIFRKGYLKYLWYRHSCFFHWAHKPLCSRFQKGVIRFGPFYFCKGCFMFYSGMMSAFLSLWFWHQNLSPIANLLFITLCGVILPLSCPHLYNKLPRPLCDFLRFGTGYLPVLLVWLFYLENYRLAVFASLILGIFALIYGYQRKKRKHRACDGCLELEGENICSGFSLQAQAVRKYEELATEFLLASGYIPDMKKRRRPRKF